MAGFYIKYNVELKCVNLHKFSNSMLIVELKHVLPAGSMFWEICLPGKSLNGLMVTNFDQFIVCFSFLVDPEDIKRISNTLNILASEKLKLSKVTQFHYLYRRA